MGNARRRGTYEERRASAIAARDHAADMRAAELAAQYGREAEQSPEVAARQGLVMSRSLASSLIVLAALGTLEGPGPRVRPPRWPEPKSKR
jgi:hypothetical protein